MKKSESGVYGELLMIKIIKSQNTISNGRYEGETKNTLFIHLYISTPQLIHLIKFDMWGGWGGAMSKL
jgi:hypothetical protein